MKFHSIEGRFYRIVFADHQDQVLNGVRSPFGRYHHDGQAAFYASPRPGWAAKAVDAYLEKGEPKRVIVPLRLNASRIVDIRDLQQCEMLGISEAQANTPWADQHESGERATSWGASDAIRDCGADGMIYTGRNKMGRWHVVLFNWNNGGGTTVTPDGPSIPFEWR